MDKYMITAANEICEIMDSATKLTMSQTTEASIMDADPADLEMAKLLIRMKEAIGDYILAEASEIHMINTRLDALTTLLASGKGDKD